MEIYKNEKRRKDKADTATIDKVLDPKTKRILNNLQKREKLFDLGGCFSSGKEANVYTANCSTSLISKLIQDNHVDSNEIVPVVLKIYKTSTMLFRDRIRYIIDEKRFANFCTSNSRKLIKVWAEKEVRNLKRLEKHGILCPKPLYLKRTILIMSLVGNETPSPRLRDAPITNWQNAYDECIDILKRMYQKARLVHADFSEYNLIYHNERIYVIDVGQSVETGHENANSFLATDICNINEFFSKKSVNLRREVDIFEDITGLNVPSYLRDMKLNSESFIPTRINDVVNDEDLDAFIVSEEYTSSEDYSNDLETTEDDEAILEEDESKEEFVFEDESSTGKSKNSLAVSLDNINIYVRKLKLKNPEITSEEEKEYNKQRKRIVKEMNRERRINRVLKEQDTKIKRLNKKQNKKKR